MNFNCKTEQNVSIKKHTYFKLGGTADYIVYPNNKENLIEILKKLKKENIKHKIIGKGSNLIFSDKDYKGVLIKLDNLNNYEIKDNILNIEAGANLLEIANILSKKGYSGLEFATGIPGTIGGAIYMNAGAYNFDIGSIVEEVELLNPNYEIEIFKNKDMNFNYRTSFLQDNKDYICLSTKLKLTKGNKEEIMSLVEDRRKRRLSTQPLEYPSAGSVFRNPKDDFAGRLIEEAGLKGHIINGAQISQKHANFIINLNNAKSQDVKDLIELVKTTIKDKYNVELKEEQEYVNWE